MNEILSLHEQARRLTSIHGTSLNYELNRKAREHGHVDWQAMIECQLSHIQVALGLKQRWLREVMEEDGDLGGWLIVPAYNPFLPEYLPPPGHDRNVYIQAITTLLANISSRGEDDYICMVAAVFLRWEIASALLQSRRPCLIEGGIVLHTLEERIRAQARAQAKAGKNSRNHISVELLEIAREYKSSDPEGAILIEEMAKLGVGRLAIIIGRTIKVFRCFKNPAIAKLVA